MKSKFTYGKSDAAVYLADYLMQKDNEYVTRKVSAKFVLFFRQVKELTFSDLSPVMKVWALNHLQNDFASSEQVFTDDQLVYNLMKNVARGRIREAFRTLQENDPDGYKHVLSEISVYEPKGYSVAE
jgi:hypothetical protein